MKKYMIGIFKTLLPFAFTVHDRTLSVLAQRMKIVKMILLLVAHMSLFGIFFPEFRKDFGELAGNLLVAILFLSPISAITGMPLLRIVMGFRREVGILMAYLAIVHGTGYVFDPTYSGVSILPYIGADFFAMDPQVLFGIIGIILTFPLLLTSNAFALKRLGGRNWKRLHMLVYPLFAVVAVHRFLFVTRGEAEIIVGLFQSTLLIGAYGLLKYAAWKKESFAFFRKPIEFIAVRYKESL